MSSHKIQTLFPQSRWTIEAKVVTNCGHVQCCVKMAANWVKYFPFHFQPMHFNSSKKTTNEVPLFSFIHVGKICALNFILKRIIVVCGWSTWSVGVEMNRICFSEARLRKCCIIDIEMISWGIYRFCWKFLDKRMKGYFEIFIRRQI